jgi:hypothetical protein
VGHVGDDDIGHGIAGYEQVERASAVERAVGRIRVSMHLDRLS